MPEQNCNLSARKKVETVKSFLCLFQGIGPRGSFMKPNENIIFFYCNFAQIFSFFIEKSIFWTLYLQMFSLSLLRSTPYRSVVILLFLHLHDSHGSQTHVPMSTCLSF